MTRSAITTSKINIFQLKSNLVLSIEERILPSIRLSSLRVHKTINCAGDVDRNKKKLMLKNLTFLVRRSRCWNGLIKLISAMNYFVFTIIKSSLTLYQFSMASNVTQKSSRIRTNVLMLHICVCEVYVHLYVCRQQVLCIYFVVSRISECSSSFNKSYW